MNPSIDRWKFGYPPKDPTRWVEHLEQRLRNLERTLGVLHGRVEYPAPLVLERIACTAQTEITSTSFVDITGATTTFTPEVDMIAQVNVVFEVLCNTFAAISNRFRGALVVNGVVQDGQAFFSPSALSDRATVPAGPFAVSLTAGTSYTFKLQGRTSGAANTYQVGEVNGEEFHTGFTLLKVPVEYVVP